MGYQMTAIMEKNTDHGWVEIPVQGMDKYDPNIPDRIYCRVEGFGNQQFRWLGLDGLEGAIRGQDPNFPVVDWYFPVRPLPDDLSAAAAEEVAAIDSACEYGFSYFLVEELINYDWDKVVMDGNKQTTIREFVGPVFIDWIKELKVKGVERVIFTFG